MMRQADRTFCYVLTCNEVVYFRLDECCRAQNGWVGFNPQNDFLTGKPSAHTFDKSEAYFPGIAYNLVFIMEKEI